MPRQPGKPSQADLKVKILREVAAQNRAIADPHYRPSPAPRHRRRFRLPAILLVLLIIASLLTILPNRTARDAGTFADWTVALPSQTGQIHVFAPQPLPRLAPFPIRSTAPSETLDLADLLAPTSPPIATLFGLQFRTIVLDPGHGGYDSGAVGPTGLTEKELTLDVAERLRRRLQLHDGYRVRLTRDQDVKITLRERIEFAARERGDLLVSLHFNSLPQSTVNLVETFVFGTEFDRRAANLAARENRGSDLALGDFNRIVAQLGNRIKIEEAKRLATALQSALVSDLRASDPNLVDAGVKTAPFVLLLGANMPAVLVEIACLSNPEEEQRLRTGAHRQRIAAALERGILSYLETQQTTRPATVGDQTHVGSEAK